MSAQTLGQGFARLEQHGVILTQIADKLKLAVGLRNIARHGYAGADVALCHRAATEGLKDLEDFAREVSAWAVGR